MIPFLPMHSTAPCIFIDGPLEGRVDTIACLAPDWPANEKGMLLDDEKTVVIYELIYIDKPKPHWKKDATGRYILTLKEK